MAFRTYLSVVAQGPHHPALVAALTRALHHLERAAASARHPEETRLATVRLLLLGDGGVGGRDLVTCRA